MTAEGQVMLFKAGGRAYGIALEAVRRVIGGEFITPIPRTAPTVAGAILFEGQAVPVFYASQPDSARERDELILILQHESYLMGLVIDNVLRISETEEEGLEKGITPEELEGTPFKMLTTDELIPSGFGDPRGGKNDEENPAGR